MKGDPIQIPAHIFDWLEQKDFSALNASQQEEALLYFSRESYDELHQAVTGIRSVSDDGQAARREIRKQQLLERFDTAHKKTSRLQLFQRPVALWKAAAVFLLFGSAGVYAALLQRNLPGSEVLVTLRDTVYVMQEVKSDPIHIFDTVYLVKEAQMPARSGKAVISNEGKKPLSSPAFSGINVLSVKDIDNVPNQQKHTSIKDDSLIRKFSFVSLL